MDDNEKLTSTVEVDKPKLPLLGKIAWETVISYTAALALTSREQEVPHF